MSSNNADNKTVESLYAAVYEINLELRKLHEQFDNAFNNPGSDVRLKGDVIIEKTLEVIGNTTLRGDLTVEGALNATISGDSKINITSTEDSVDTTSGSIVTAGGIGVGKSIHVGGDMVAHSVLHVLGTSTMEGKVAINGGGLDVTGPTVISNTLDIGQKLTVVSGGLDIGGTSLFRGPVTSQEIKVIPSSTTATNDFGCATSITGKLTCSDILRVTSGGVDATGDSQIDGKLFITNSTTIAAGGLNVLSGGLNVVTNGITVTGGVATLICTMDITGNTNITGDTTIFGDLTVAGIDPGVVFATNTGKLTGGQITDNEIKDAANIQWSKLALMNAPGDIIMGDSKSVPTSMAISGDVTFSGTGVSTIGASKVTNDMLVGGITDDKLSTISTTGKIANTATSGTNLATANTLALRDSSGNAAFNKLDAVNVEMTGQLLMSVTGSKIVLDTDSDGIFVREGSTAISGTTQLAAGSVTVTGVTKLADNARIMFYPYLTSTDTFTPSNYGHLVVTNLGSNAFSVRSSNALDDRRIHYVIITPL